MPLHVATFTPQVGDVVRWAHNAERTMVEWGRQEIQLHPINVIHAIPDESSLIVADIYTGETVTRVRDKDEYKRTTSHHWDISFFMKDEFLTAAYKANKGT